MSKGDTFENDLLKLIFQALDIALIADNAVSTPLTELFVSLHVGDPGEAGTQQTNEATYGDYARVGVARTSGGWAVTTNNADNVAAITFPEASSGSETVDFFAIGTLTSGAGKILYSGALTSGLAVSVGITPQFAIGDCNVTED
jgi:hypothetical protein